MEKDRGFRIIAIVALCVAILGLSIGFAAFTKDLNIIFTDSNVKINGDLDIKFLASNNVNDTNKTIIAQTDAVSENANILTNSATISTDGTTISGIGATFSDKDQMVFYDFYIYNNSEYDAYLKSVEFLDYVGYDSNKVCRALEGTTQSLVDDACKDIHIGIAIGDEIILDNNTNNFTSPKIPKGETLFATITIVYAGEMAGEDLLIGGGNALVPNGDFKINFGDIKFSYSTLEG